MVSVPSLRTSTATSEVASSLCKLSCHSRLGRHHRSGLVSRNKPSLHRNRPAGERTWPLQVSHCVHFPALIASPPIQRLCTIANMYSSSFESIWLLSLSPHFLQALPSPASALYGDNAVEAECVNVPMFWATGTQITGEKICPRSWMWMYLNNHGRDDGAKRDLGIEGPLVANAMDVHSTLLICL